MASVIEETPGTSGAIATELKGLGDNYSIKDELTVLRRFAGLHNDGEAKAEPKEAPTKKPASMGSKAKMTFQITRPQGAAKCVAGAGRLEIKLDKDFSGLDRKQLEEAVAAFLDKLE